MKKITAFISALLLIVTLHAQESAYLTAMEAALETMKEVKSMEDWNNLANTFERIAEVEASEWLPGYYVALAHIMVSFREKDGDTKDEILDKAQVWVTKLIASNPNESEIHAMQGFIHQARISVSPMMRGMSYSQKAQASFEKAIELNPENPRAYYLWGQNVMNTPGFFGGGKEKACPIFQKARAKYEAYEAVSSISPMWGETPTMRLAEGCE